MDINYPRRILLAEIKKQYRNYNRNLASFMSLIIWPLLSFLSIYYIYESFDLSVLHNFNINSKKDFIIFITSGTLVYNCFWVSVQSAFEILEERQNGTIEFVFLSPVNRLLLMYAKAFGCLYSSLGLLIIFSIIIVLTMEITAIVIFKILLLLVLITFCSMIWGGFINVFFLISRDSTFVFTVCDEPMRFFSGSMVPVNTFPFVFKAISIVFPATHCTKLVQTVLLGEKTTFMNYFGLFLSLASTFIITFILMRKAERQNMNTGNLQLY
ncbi:hypothetical protein IGJ02_000377 [Enterococcus sp. DIV0724b]|uniref:ABC transporter permease n=1 Tax=Enterococcus sp. DIV0724b TaxID=2774694 RepID=UPI003D2FBAE6